MAFGQRYNGPHNCDGRGLVVVKGRLGPISNMRQPNSKCSATTHFGTLYLRLGFRMLAPYSVCQMANHRGRKSTAVTGIHCFKHSDT